MAATTIGRATWTDGASPTGTLINNARLHADVYDKVDTVLSSAITFGSTVTAEGFGTHSFSSGGTGVNTLRVRNTSAGTGNYARVSVGNNSSTDLIVLDAFSSTFTTSGSAIAGGCRLHTGAVAGLAISSSDASGPIKFYAGGTTERARLETTGALLVSDGSTVSTPGIAFLNETDSGLWRQGAGQYHLVCNGVSALRITESGGNITFDTTTAVGKWSSHMIPNVSATYDLGTTLLRWNETWCTRNAFNGSDARLKHDIEPIALGLDFIKATRPVSYRWRTGRQDLNYGFIAQDLLALDFAGVDTSNPDEYALRYNDLIAPLVRAVQELSARVDLALEARS